MQHPAPARAAAQRLPRPFRHVPALLRPKSDARKVLLRLRRPAGRIRDDGRALRGRNADPDPQDPELPRGPDGQGLLAAADGSAGGNGPRGDDRTRGHEAPPADRFPRRGDGPHPQVRDRGIPPGEARPKRQLDAGGEGVVMLPLLLLMSAQTVGAATNAPDPYLQQAFVTLSPWAVTGRAKALAERIREAALYGTWFKLAEEDRTIPGPDAVAGLADLLCDTDPRVRLWGATALHDWDRWESLPFLIGLLTDTDAWRPRGSGDGTATNTVSAAVAGILDGDFVCDPLDRRRVSIHDMDDPLAVEHSMQRWYHAHMPYCFVTSERLLPAYYCYPMAAYFSIPPCGLKALRLVEPERFEKGLVPSLEI